MMLRGCALATTVGLWMVGGHRSATNTATTAAAVKSSSEKAAQRGFFSTNTLPSSPQGLHHTLNWEQGTRVILVGDVHGCAQELRDLLDKVKFQREEDTLIFVGDLVRKGPDSRSTVQIARENGAKMVRGNHDHYALEDSSNQLGLTQLDLDYLRSAPLSITIPQLNVLVVHAGMLPWVKSVHDMDPIDLMSMRNVVYDTSQGEWYASEQVRQGKAWVEEWKGPQRVVFGHDAVRGLQQTPFATGLDTGCVYGKQLTCLILPGDEIVSVPSHQPIPSHHKVTQRDQ